MTCELTPVRCGCGEIGVGMSDLIRREDAIDMLKELEVVESDNFTKTDPVTKLTVATIADCIEGIVELPSAQSERTAKATRRPEAFFYRCECGYGLCCEKNDMNYCPSCGGRLEWNDER